MKKAIIASENHPLYSLLKHLKDFSRTKDVGEVEIVFDFTVSEFDKKKSLIESLSPHLVVSDLTCCRGEDLLASCKNLGGAVACAFFSPKNCYEFFSREVRAKRAIENLFKELNIGGVPVSSPGIGFNYPRILSLVINEAYSALEDQLADRESIDTAMKYGVNYPLGPFEWGEKIGTGRVRMLLDELYRATGNERYKASSLLDKAF